MSAIRQTNSKSLMLFSGRAYPELADEVAGAPRRRADPDGVLRVRQRRDLRPVRGVGPRLRRLRLQSHTAPINKWVMEQLIMVDALKRASAKRITVVAPFFPLRPPGQEAPRPRADLGAADRRPVQDRRRRPADGGRPAHRADPGLLRRPGRPPVRAADLWPTTSRASWRPRRHRRRPRTPAGCGSAERWTDRLGGVPLAFIHKTPRPDAAQRGRSPTAWSVTSRAGPASWSTT